MRHCATLKAVALDPAFPQKLLRASTLQDWRDYHDQIGDDLGKADAVGDFKRMAECVRKLGGGSAGFCTTQPHPELSAAD
eukprot:SAG11_NODE_35789_length_265_cov_0.602410_1_plen_79_part_01